MYPNSSEKLDQRLEVAVLGGILVVAAVLRFYNLSHQGFLLNDEGGYLVGAQRFTLTSYDLSYTFYRPGFILLVVLSALFVGFSPLAVAGVSAVAGMLTVWLVYGLTRQLFERRVALVATALLATSSWHIYYSRVGLSNATATFFWTLGLWAWVRFSQNRAKSFWAAGLAGVSFGYAFTCHYGLAPFLAVLALIEIWQAFKARVVWGTLLLVLGGGLPPLVFYAIGGYEPGAEVFRLGQVVQLRGAGFVYYLELLGRYETPLFTLAAALGIGRALHLIRQRRLTAEAALYLLLFGALIFLSIGAVRGQGAPRLMAPVLPLLAVFAGGGVTFFLSRLRFQGRSMLWGTTVGLILSVGVAMNREPLSWRSGFAEAADYLHTRYPTGRVFCSAWWPVCEFYDLGRQPSDAAYYIHEPTPTPQFFFSQGGPAWGLLLASFDNSVERYPMVAEDNAPGSVRGRQVREIPGVIRVYDLRAGSPSGAALITRARQGDTAAVELLLAAGVVPDAQDAVGTTALMMAAAHGHLTTVEALLGKGAQVNARTRLGTTALMHAAANGHLPIVQRLLAQGADPNARTQSGGTALMGAAAKGHVAVVATLLVAGADIGVKTETGATALMGAAANGHEIIVQLLRQAGAQDEQHPGVKRQAPKPLNIPVGPGALITRARQGDTAAVEFLLAAGVNPNAEGALGETALMGAAAHGHLPIVQRLLAQGADPNARTQSGGTALMAAVSHGYTSIGIVQALLAHGAEVNVRQVDGWTALMGAAAHGHLTTVEALLGKGAQVNARTRLGTTALMHAAANGHLPIVQRLLAYGAEVNARQVGGGPVVQALLAHGSTVKVKTYTGGTALMQAAEGGHTPVVEALLAAGADTNARTLSGATALMRAAANGHTAIVHALLAAGAEVNARTQGGATALMVAAVDGHTTIVHALLEDGAEVNARQVNGWTAMMGATEGGHTEVVELLKRAGTERR